MRSSPLALALVALASCAVALAAPARTARAATPDDPKTRTSSLSWVRLPGAESCVATQTLARAVEERLGRAVFVSAAQADVSVEGRIEPARKGGWRAVVTLRDAKGALLGTREIARADKGCEAMNEPLALVIAVMIDPDAALATPGANAQPQPQPTPPPAPAPAPPPQIVYVPVPTPAPPPPPRKHPWFFEGGAGVIGALGLLPSVAPGVHVDGMIEPPKVPITLIGFGAAFLDQTVADAASAGSASFATGYIGSGLCVLRVRAVHVHLFLCIEGHIGAITARPSGFPGASQEVKALVNSAGELRLSVPVVGPFSARAGASAVVPWLRDRWTYARADGTSVELFRVSPVVGQVDVGAGVIFP